MKKILCFGDSNVYGFVPENGRRYDKHTRWSGVLQQLGKDCFEVVEAGCNNRTGFKDNPCGIEQTGYRVLPTLLCETFDLIVLAIGINDLQFSYNTSLKEIEHGLDAMILMCKKSCPKAEILIVSPSVISKKILKSCFSEMFDETSIEKSYYLSEIYEKTAKNHNCKFLDLNKIAEVSEADGLHYSADEHKKIAKAVFELVC